MLPQWGQRSFTAENLLSSGANLAQELSFGTVVLVEERFWCITTRAGAGIIESPLLEWNISADKI